MSVLTEKAVVKKEELWDVVGTNQWTINNSLDKDYEPRPARIIVREACALVGKTLPYCVFRGNCEHFVNELRYGKAESRQVGGHMFFYTQDTLLSRGQGAAKIKDVYLITYISLFRSKYEYFITAVQQHRLDDESMKYEMTPREMQELWTTKGRSPNCTLLYTVLLLPAAVFT